MRPNVVLAVDIGSTWCKAAYLDPHGRNLAQGRSYTRDIPLHRTKTLEGFWQAFVASVRAATQQMGVAARPAAISIACRALFGVCLDESGHGYVPVWDTRLDRHLTPEMRDAYGTAIWGDKNPFVHGYAPGFGGLLLWLRRHRPQEYTMAQRVGALRDYIVFRMTGAWVTDPSTGPNQYTWPEEVLALAGLPRDAFPTILSPHHVAGQLSKDAGQALGLPAGTPVTVGQHDGAAANLGVGAIRPGDGCFTLGTNFVFRGVTGSPLSSFAFGYWIAPGVWSWVGNIPGAAMQFERASRQLAVGQEEISEVHRRLAERCSRVDPGTGELPLRLSPPDQIAGFIQSVRNAQQEGQAPEVIYRAILEAVALGERRLVARARADGVEPVRFVATGGGAHNQTFIQVLADMLNEPIELGQPDGGILGAGIVAAVGAGWYATVDEAVSGMCRPGPIVVPEPETAAIYRHAA